MGTCFLLIGLVLMSAIPATPGKIRTLYNSLDPYSIAQHLAFYELYPTSTEGQQALQDAWNLLNGSSTSIATPLTDPDFGQAVSAIVSLVNKQSTAAPELLKEKERTVVSQIGQRLANRSLKGSSCKNESEVLALPPQEIDLARGLFLTQFGSTPEGLAQVQTYEALIDLMALQIAAKLPAGATPAQKIRVMNDFIFTEMGFRFPPHSAYAKEIDLYTFLPSVLDNRRGVCLGVSILYICLAQRLNLPLEMITPPGHIYVRYRNPNEEINIETTARGIHIDSEEYLNVDTKALQQRTIKEVIGLAYFNQASVFLGEEKYQEALDAYKRALPYLPDDKLLIELMAYQYLLLGQLDEGKRLLKQVNNVTPEHQVTRDSMADDYLQGRFEADALRAFFLRVDETRESLIKKREALEDVVNRYPQFRAGIFSLAITWLQLHRGREALELLERYHALDPNDATAEYYLTALHAERNDYTKAWEHLRQTEKLVHERDHHPKMLKKLRQSLAMQFPE
ncbi:MAG: tetratricopeptide repeat protein [Parachlamydiaceae bacterium]|nr:tetratricopeptide repeat protein [Parachlamydiaceae bacterium]